MSTNAPPGGPAADPAAGGSKAATKVMEALAALYMEKHKAAPDSPECEAVMSMMKATAELDGPGGLEAPELPVGPEGGMPPEGDMPPGEDPLAAMQAPPMDGGGMTPPSPDVPGMTLDDAISGLYDETQAAGAEEKKRRRPF